MIVLSVILLGTYCALSQGLSDIRIKSRDAIEVGKQLRLGCDYFLSDSRDGQEELYSISWYWTPRISNDGIDFRLWGKSGLKYRPTYPKTTVPFFRYRKIDPDKTRKVAWDSELRGIFDVNVHGSTGTSVLLDRVSLSAEGTFSCEVITLPNFITKTGSKYLEVARIPKQWERPEIHFRGGKNKLRYSPGDTIDVECISKGGYPPPNITWFINGEKAQLFGLEPLHFSPQILNSSEFKDWDKWRPETKSQLKLVIDSTVMTSGNLKIKCVVHSYQLYHQSNEVSIETFGIKPTPKSVVQKPFIPTATASNSNDIYTAAVYLQMIVILMINVMLE